MIWGILIGLFVGVSFGVILGGLLAGSDDRAEYEEAVEELGKALRESYAWIHVSGDWDEFERTGFTIDPPEPTAIADGERRAARAARARARERGDVVPLGHVRLGIDPPSRDPIGPLAGPRSGRRRKAGSMSSDLVRTMATRYRLATARYWELSDEAVIAIANAVSKDKANLGTDGAVRDVAETIGEDWRVVLACFRTAHPNPRLPNPIAQNPDGSVRRNLELEDDHEPKLRDHFAIGDLAPCRVCGEELTPHGKTCERCERSIAYDRLERESGR